MLIQRSVSVPHQVILKSELPVFDQLKKYVFGIARLIPYVQNKINEEVSVCVSFTPTGISPSCPFGGRYSIVARSIAQ